MAYVRYRLAGKAERVLLPQCGVRYHQEPFLLSRNSRIYDVPTYSARITLRSSVVYQIHESPWRSCLIRWGIRVAIGYPAKAEVRLLYHTIQIALHCVR